MKISKVHKRFSERLQDPRVLTNPEEFLGPNYKAVLNFWLILDDLSEEQLKLIEGFSEDFCNKPYSEWLKVIDEALKASYQTIGYKYTNQAIFVAGVCFDTSFTSEVTLELIGMHLLLDQNKPLTIFPMFLNQ